MKNKYISWFSCGAASAVATKIAIKEYGDIRVIYQDTGSEHPDNKRFLIECEEWFGQKIEITKSDKYNNIWEVFEKTRYLVGPSGARCTTELKKNVANKIINWGEHQEFEVFGYTSEEVYRVERFKQNNPERKIVTPLIDKGLNKDDCLGMLWKARIKIPAMYELGYNNNNCIGCVKGGAGYWNKIRQDFPEVFDRMAKVERDLGRTIIKEGNERIYLDELDPNKGNHKHEKSISCGLFCQIESDNL